MMLNKLLCKTRNIVFWFSDLLNDGHVKFAYNEIKKIDNMDAADIVSYHNQKFEKLASHAIETTDYYKDIKRDDVASFPIVNKSIIKANQKRFLSDKHKEDSLYEMSTSGSTGTPFTVYQDIVKKRRVNAEIIYYSEKAGYSVGNSLIYMRAITEKSQKSKFHQWIQNETLIDISYLDEKSIELIIDKIIDSSVNKSTILAYASTYDVLRDYFTRHGYSRAERANITGIISGSEMLFDDTRELLSKAFNCPVYSRYSNQENGVIGQDDTENNVFIINEANYIVEILDMRSDHPVCEGELGRIVITDLFNYAMPMIRYDTGDIGSITTVYKNGLWKKAITNFGGRKVDMVYDSFGNLLSPHAISTKFWGFSEIKLFQFIQESKKEYAVKIVSDKFTGRSKLEQSLRSLLGNEASLKIESVNEIPLLASGKRKYIVNRMITETNRYLFD